MRIDRSVFGVQGIGTSYGMSQLRFLSLANFFKFLDEVSIFLEWVISVINICIYLLRGNPHIVRGINLISLDLFILVILRIYPRGI